MLRKLLKYELRSVYQTLLPLYGAVLAAMLVNSLFWYFDGLRNLSNGTPLVIVNMVCVALMIAMATICMLLIIQRFYNGLLSQEGYLMFTLPVKPWQHICSKLITASLMLITSGLVVVLTVLMLIIGLRVELSELVSDVIDLTAWAFRNFSVHGVLYLLEAMLLVFVFVEKNLLKAYAAMSLGHLSTNHRMVLSFAAYAGLGIAVTLFWTLLGGLLRALHLMEFLVNHFSPEALPRIPAVHAFFWIGILWQGAEAAAYYLITHRVLSRHLNLE